MKALSGLGQFLRRAKRLPPPALRRTPRHALLQFPFFTCCCCCFCLLHCAVAGRESRKRAHTYTWLAPSSSSSSSPFPCFLTPPPPFSSTSLRIPQQTRTISSTTPLRLNRLLFESEEVVEGAQGILTARMDKADPRTRHVQKILKAQTGDEVRVGVLNGGRNDNAPIEWKSDGSLSISLGPSQSLLQPPQEEERPRVDLLLAMQAPLRMERIIPHVVALGVGRIFITSGKKVEKSYWGSHLLREPSALRELIKEGLTQAGDTIVPEVLINRRLKRFLQDDLERFYPSSSSQASHQPSLRVIAHPFRELPDSPAVDTRLRHLRQPETHTHTQATAAGELDKGTSKPKPTRLLLAIGPESGWDEPYELDLFREYGFQQVTLGPRVLRTETAVPALLALAHDLLDSFDEKENQRGDKHGNDDDNKMSPA